MFLAETWPGSATLTWAERAPVGRQTPNSNFREEEQERQQLNVILSQLDKVTLQVPSTLCTELEDLEIENHITVPLQL